ncbi:MAG: hypothetical protein ACPHRO_08100, partial [Nannocystaceae bacterium]
VRLRLARIVRQYGETEFGSFVTHEAQFRRLKALYEENRVTLIRGNLLGPTAVKAIGGVFEEFNKSPRVVYLSNAEQYFRYSPAFLENIEALQLSSSTRVLRTLSQNYHGFAEEDTYHYNVQTGVSLLTYLREGRLPSVGRMLTEKQKTGVTGLSTLGDMDLETAR